MVSNIQNLICSKLMTQKILNKRIEKKLYEINDVKRVKSFYRKLTNRKKRILKLNQTLCSLSISVDISDILLNLDIYGVNEIYSLLQKKFEFDEQRIFILLKLAKTDIPKTVLFSLKNSKGNSDFDKILDLIPPIFLFRNKVLKPADIHIRVEKSIKFLSTPMRN